MLKPISPLLFALVAVFASVSLMAAPTKWETLGPGGGATITSVSCNPDKKNHIWVGTRSHGLYFSHNAGEAWIHYGSDLANGVITAITLEPQEREHSNPKERPKRGIDAERGQRIYAGGAQGLFISDSNGFEWTSVKDLEDVPIGKILVNPYNTDQVFVIEGWTTLDDEIETLLADGEKLVSDRKIWVSNDRGESFKGVKYEKSKGYRRAYSLSIDHNEPSTLYLGAHSGAYKSTNSGKSWKRLNDPKGAKSGVKAKTREDGCRGVDLSSGGAAIVGVFANAAGKYVPYYSETKRLRWIEISEGLPGGESGGGRRRRGSSNEWAMPRFGGGEMGAESILLAQLGGTRLGLYRGSLTVDKKSPKVVWKQICQSPDGDGEEDFKFPMGWTERDFRVRCFDLSPASWGKSQIWLSTTETILVGYPNGNGFPYSSKSWRDVTSKPKSKSRKTFSSVGLNAFSATQIVSADSYQACGTLEHGLLESFDGGTSWKKAEEVAEFARAIDSVALVQDRFTVVFVAARQTWGRRAGRVTLAAKTLLNKDDSDDWVLIGGGANDIAGFPDDRVNKILPHRSRKSHMAVATAKNGIMYTTEIGAIVGENGGKWENITKGSPLANTDVVDIAFDPLERDALWAVVRGKKGGLYRGDLKNKRWKWKFVHSVKASETLGPVSVTAPDGETRQIVMSYASSSKSPIEVMISRDDGDEFKTVFTMEEAKTINGSAWLDERNALNELRVEAMVVLEGDLILSIGDPSNGRGLGLFRIHFDSKGAHKASAWNSKDAGVIQQKRITSLSAKQGGKMPTIYAGMPGAGMAKRTLDEFVPWVAPEKKEDEGDKKEKK